MTSARWPAITPATVTWDAGGAPRSTTYGDIYFQPDDGIAESEHVFLGGAQVRTRWCNRRTFAIGETGFGTGLNFLTTWRAWRDDPARPRVLTFCSIEAHPLTAADAHRALTGYGVLGVLTGPLLTAWPAPLPGPHLRQFEGGRVRLIVWHADVATALADWGAPVDAWYLDGFAPAGNSAMWSDAVLAKVGSLSRPGATLATFTAAGAVRRGLVAGGFETSKVKGYGCKREMIVATKPGQATDSGKLGRVGLIGAGIAGAALYRSLVAHGYDPIWLEAGATPAAGASGNALGLVHPRLALEPTTTARMQLAAMHHWAGLHVLDAGAGAAIAGQGLLDVATTPAVAARAIKLADQGAVAACGGALLDQAAASDAAGVSLPGGGILAAALPWIRPAALCQAWAPPGAARFGALVMRAEERGAGAGWALHLSAAHGGGEIVPVDTLFVANAGDAARLFAHRLLGLRAVQGQVVQVQPTQASAGLRLALGYGGYLTPAVDGAHIAGATFERLGPWQPMPAPTSSVIAPGPALADTNTGADQEILAKLGAALPSLAGLMTAPVLGRRAAVRASTADHRPLLGGLGDGAWLLAGLGSHGLLTAPLLADALVAQAHQQPVALDHRLATDLRPDRFAAPD